MDQNSNDPVYFVATTQENSDAEVHDLERDSYIEEGNYVGQTSVGNHALSDVPSWITRVVA